MSTDPQQSGSAERDELRDSRGLGGLPVVGEHRAMADIRLIGRAIRRRWPVGPRARRSVTAAMLGVVENERTDDDAAGLKVAAARVLVAMGAQNQSDEHHADKLAQDDKHLKLDAARVLAGVSTDDKIALIRRAGYGHLLPAEANTEAESPPKEPPCPQS